MVRAGPDGAIGRDKHQIGERRHDAVVPEISPMDAVAGAAEPQRQCAGIRKPAPAQPVISTRRKSSRIAGRQRERAVDEDRDEMEDGGAGKEPHPRRAGRRRPAGRQGDDDEQQADQGRGRLAHVAGEKFCQASYIAESIRGDRPAAHASVTLPAAKSPHSVAKIATVPVHRGSGILAKNRYPLSCIRSRAPSAKVCADLRSSDALQL